ncbi:MAG: biosynthetic-type acetolactate synthase large subunit [Verrucomicrobia bacterium]|nr:biosynthetic-type acetolactate synthase large subunit [Verrucomicrobiota bacterium]MCG2678597.1 biosynthetic-type acetolactate synthase large subunit [Kiritimatiellia bacterium]MBU4247915.1 biosynthetic-type acetolactate synthase large subunit [Verrucomicrobiota bacterium]MBU4291661.1 biosynthetic-type acetolactate synthase large subunit [Verrucomicrobiota bacterium]MBU4427841.1 biosynthetic-type acetolactate synthase large subunit [Verrucomicrobiota bacterium]
MRTGVECLMDGLKKAGVKTIFGLPGGSVLDIFDKLYTAPFEFVLTRHEQGATHMADGYARATGQVGCCLVTSGPGATNTVTGLATAYMDSIPVVCISGQVPSSMIGNDAFQEADTTGITRPVTKHNYLVRNVDDLPRIIAEAFHIAGTGRPGPVLVDIPKDVQRASTKAPTPDEVKIRGYNPTIEGHPKQIARLAEAINKSKKPLLYVGGGAILSNAAEEVTALARKANIPVTTTLLGLGCFPETDPLALRMLGMHGSVTANYATHHCDLMVSVGARFDDRVTGKISEFAPRAEIAHIDIDPSAISKSVPVDIPVVGDAKNILRNLIPQVEAKERKEWLDQIAAWKAKYPFTYDQKGSGLMPQYVIEQIYALTKGDAIIVTEVGQHQMWSAQYYQYTQPRTFISSGGLGTMGFGLPAAIGARMGRPDKLVVDISGDGSAQMNFQELVVAVEHQVPIKVVILNNGHLGMVRQWQEMFYHKQYSATRLGRRGRGKNENIPEPAADSYLPDFVKLAEAHGALGLRVKTRAEVIPTLEKAFASELPAVVECLVEPEANVYPMVPAGASLTEMIQSMA